MLSSILSIPVLTLSSIVPVCHIFLSSPLQRLVVKQSHACISAGKALLQWCSSLNIFFFFFFFWITAHQISFFFLLLDNTVYLTQSSIYAEHYQSTGEILPIYKQYEVEIYINQFELSPPLPTAVLK